MKISIIIPVYNEEKTVAAILDKVARVKLGLQKEIIIVNDGSNDDSKRVIEGYLRRKRRKNIYWRFITKENGGKGSAVRKGIELASGDIITIQDADSEYNPEDYRKLIAPILEGKEVVVYGSRFLGAHEPLYRVYFWGNKFLTFITKILYRARITDMETCYKVFRADVIKDIPLRAHHFEIEPEVTAKILLKGIRIKEIPISYRPRSVEEGKKIGWRDGIQAIGTLMYWRFLGSREDSSTLEMPIRTMQKRSRMQVRIGEDYLRRKRVR